MKTTTRKIVKIDEARCNGCGLCVPSCAEGAIRIIDGKARLVADNLCDGLGNCLGKCPQDAITIEERPAEAFDESAVGEQANPTPAQAATGHADAAAHHSGGCPGSMLRKLNPAPAALAAVAPVAAAGQPVPSQLGHWPIQLTLLPEQGPIWAGADVLLAADCVAFVMGDFQSRLLSGKTLAIACPKLDDGAAYVEKLARIFAANDIRSVTVAHMEVPCCFSLGTIVERALRQAGKAISIKDITVGIDGRIKA